MKPPTIEQAEERGLVTSDRNRAIHTFSNGSHWEGWASGNCFECRHWDPEKAGSCAFECAAFLDMVTPDLARMFGWTQNPKYDQIKGPDDHCHGWHEPEQCSFFSRRRDDDGEDTPPPPEPDPLQLVLIADPTEDAALMRDLADVPDLVGAA